MDARFFPSAVDLHAWLETNHAVERELLVGFYKKGLRRPSITYPQALDEALCFGWIDGVRKGVDATSYTIRFSPRKSKSIWSAVNIKRAGELVELARMRPAGLSAFEGRDPARANLYSFEQRSVAFDDVLETTFRANAAAWLFFEAQPPGYRRTATWYVMSAQQESTRLRRLAGLIEISERGLRLALATGKSAQT